MWFTRLENSVGDQEIEMAADSSRGKSKALPQNYGCRWAIFENRARNSVTGAEVIDFHNTIVS
jgi:hypothetical protein